MLGLYEHDGQENGNPNLGFRVLASRLGVYPTKLAKVFLRVAQTKRLGAWNTAKPA